jgi:glutamyl-tRNA synthetase
MARQARFLVCNEISYDEKAARKHLKPAIRPALEDLHAALAGLDEWSEAAIEAVFERVRASHDDLAMGKIAQPVRVAVTGGAVSPGIFETLAALGKERSVSRIAAAVAFLGAD